MTDTLSITDNRTNRSYEIPITDGSVDAMTLRRIKVDADDFGLMSYDPAFKNTASCRSEITLIDGERGVLRYRGYPIKQLAAHSSYLEVAYLLVHGELPSHDQLTEWTHEVTHHTMLHENTKKLMNGFHHDAHPMGILVSTVAALSTFYPDAKDIVDHETRMLQAYRLLGKMPTIAAYAYRHRFGLPYIQPDNQLGYAGNFLNMMFKMTETAYVPDPVLERALDLLLILHADHEQNCSTNAMRSIGSAHADPFVATAGAAAALYGPLHGGANEMVLRMLAEIGSAKNVPAYIRTVKDGSRRLMGFGHRVYRNYDPRAQILKETAAEVFEATGHNPLIDIALEVERIALEDDYFVSRKLYPNVDFYSGIIYQAMGIPTDAFTVLFAIARTAGWFAQWQELLLDPEQKIARPRQVYVGAPKREYVPIDARGAMTPTMVRA